MPSIATPNHSSMSRWLVDLCRAAGILVFCTGLALALGCSADGVPVEPRQVEAYSVSGEPLRPPTLPAAVYRDRIDRLAEARGALQEDPDDIDRLIWFGRRTAYLGFYRDAIDIYSSGLAKLEASGDASDPEWQRNVARLLRHRGHRHITVRQFTLARADLRRASELIRSLPDRVEPDGLPNPRNQPTSTLHTNIWYHLGLAEYLLGDYAAAADAFAYCVSISKNRDMEAASRYWTYLSERRAGLDDAAHETLAAVDSGWDIIENHAYYDLLLVYKGEADPDAVLDRARRGADVLHLPTTGYGIATWRALDGQEQLADQIADEVLTAPLWAAFGYIAAEVDRHRDRPRREAGER